MDRTENIKWKPLAINSRNICHFIYKNAPISMICIKSFCFLLLFSSPILKHMFR